MTSGPAVAPSGSTLARAIHTANPARKFLIRVGNWGHGGAWPPATRNNEWLADAGIAEDGYRLIMNCNRHGGQEVYHLHVHLVGGAPLGPMISAR